MAPVSQESEPPDKPGAAHAEDILQGALDIRDTTAEPDTGETGDSTARELRVRAAMLRWKSTRLCAVRMALSPIRHRLPPGVTMNWDELESLFYAISSGYPVSADGEHRGALTRCSVWNGLTG